MKIGKLDFKPFVGNFELTGESTHYAIVRDYLKDDVEVAEIDPTLSDTENFCAKYDVSPEIGVNCVIIEAKRADRVWYAACMMQSTKRIDVNNVVRRHLDARKISFASMDKATQLTGMEYGAINPIGLPEDWEILIDTDATKLKHAIIGSGIRKSKLLISGETLASLPNATVLDISK